MGVIGLNIKCNIQCLTLTLTISWIVSRLARLPKSHISIPDKVLPQGLGPVSGAVPIITRTPLLVVRARSVPDSDQVPIPVPGVIAALAAQHRVVAAVVADISWVKLAPFAAHVTGVKAAFSDDISRIESGAEVPGYGGVLGEVIGAVAGGAGETALDSEGVALIAHVGGGALVLTHLAGDHAALLIRNIFALSPKIK